MKTQSQLRLFIALCVLSLLMSWRPLLATFRLALADDAYTHILLILPLSAALIYSHPKYWRSQARPLTRYPNLSVGAPLLILSLLITGGAHWVLASSPDRLSLGVLALVLWWIGSVILCFGTNTFRAFVFPLCFLFLLVPLPQSALSAIVEFLQQQSATATRIIFQIVRVPVMQDGTFLSIPRLDIEVTQDCSSIRSTEMLVVTTLVLAYLFLRSWWKRALLVAVAIPLSIAKNGLRIFVIAELGTRVDPGFLTGRLHRQGGIIYFMLSVILMSALLYALKRTEFVATRTIRALP